MEIKKITSAQNDYIKKISSLSSKKHRDETGLFCAEGEHLVEMAVASDFEIESIIMSESYYKKNRCLFSYDTILIPDSLFSKISDAKSPQGIMAVLYLPKPSACDFCGKYIYCDNLQDPGNVGTIIRTADAFSFDGVILSPNCADIFSHKVIRSSQGSVFNIKIIQDADIFCLKKAKENGVLITSTALYGKSVTLKNMKISKKHIFVIGNEGNGVSRDILELSDEIAYIPMTGKAESLNAGVAAAILMYEVSCRE